MSEPQEQLQHIIEAALLAAGRPLTLDHLSDLFVTMTEDESMANEERKVARKRIRPALKQLQADCENRGFELVEVASGWRFQVKQHIAPHIAGLWNSRPSRYSRAMLETLALIAYRQPITRSEIEKIRGVSVSSEIMKKLLDYDWIRVLGQKSTPGHPRIYGTTTAFLDHFSLQQLGDLPPLDELKDTALEENRQLNEDAEQSMQEGLKQADQEKQEQEIEKRRLAKEAAEQKEADAAATLQADTPPLENTDSAEDSDQFNEDAEPVMQEHLPQDDQEEKEPEAEHVLDTYQSEEMDSI